MQIQPVILSGGSGTRLWPLSRELYPKQLLPLVTENSMLQETILRLQGLDAEETIHINAPLVICNEEHRFLVAEQLRSIDVKPASIMLEPVGRNTAPALTLAAAHIQTSGTDSIMLVLPADHVVDDTDSFHTAIIQGAKLAEQNNLVTFGIVPTAPETGYGYIKKGTEISDSANEIAAFVEKPDLETAQQYVDSGEFLWNSGMFMIKPSDWLTAIETFSSKILDASKEAYLKGKVDYDFYRIDAETFKTSPSDSIDYAVMEKITGKDNTTNLKAAVIPLSAGWSDVGAWPALWDVKEKDEDGNVTSGDVIAKRTKNSLLMSEGRLLATIGLSDVIIIETADAVMAMHKDHSQDVKSVVNWLKEQKREEHLFHREVYRPWGSYEGIDAGDRYQVKRITVKPGASLSLQMHHHRAEHWIVVKGTARVTRDDEILIISENQSTYIPLGIKHRLENPGSIPLEIIEIQSGSYLGEDDIVRFEDNYGRDK